METKKVKIVCCTKCSVGDTSSKNPHFSGLRPTIVLEPLSLQEL